MEKSKKVIVVGAGITGLACAYEILHQAEQRQLPLELTLLEKNPYIGGKIHTTYDGPYTLEGGPDCFILEKPWALALVRELGMTAELVNTSSAASGTYIYSRRRLHRLPDGLIMMIPTKIIPFATSPLISWPGKIRMGFDLLLPRRRGDGDESLASFVTRRLGREALDKIAEPLVGGIHAGDPANMSLQATFPRFLEMEREAGSLIRGMFQRQKAMIAARKKRPAAASPPRTFFISLRRGMAQLTEALATRIGREKILTGAEVVSLKKTVRSGYRLRTADGRRLAADAVVLAGEAFASARLLASWQPELATLLAETPYVSSSIVSLVFPRKAIPRPLDTYGFIVPRVEGRRIMATTWSSVKWPYRAPADKLLMRTFVGGAQQPHLADLDDREITLMVLDELRDIIGIKSSPEQVWINRWPQGMPQYVLGHTQRLEQIEALQARVPGLFLTGAGYRGIGIPDCINSGRETGKKVIAAL